MSVHKKIQPNRSSRLAGYTQQIYDVLFYYIDMEKDIQNYSPTMFRGTPYTLIFLPDCSHSNGCPPEGINHTGKLCGSKFFLRHIGQSTVIKQVYSVNCRCF